MFMYSYCKIMYFYCYIYVVFCFIGMFCVLFVCKCVLKPATGFKPFGTGIIFLILAHPVYKM